MEALVSSQLVLHLVAPGSSEAWHYSSNSVMDDVGPQLQHGQQVGRGYGPARQLQEPSHFLKGA